MSEDFYQDFADRNDLFNGIDKFEPSGKRGSDMPIVVAHK